MRRDVLYQSRQNMKPPLASGRPVRIGEVIRRSFEPQIWAEASDGTVSHANRVRPTITAACTEPRSHGIWRVN